MLAATANAYYDGLTVVFLGPINPTQLPEHGLFLGQNHGEKIALWHTGEAACSAQDIRSAPRLGGGNKKSPWHFHKEIINENAVDGDWKSIL